MYNNHLEELGVDQDFIEALKSIMGNDFGFLYFLEDSEIDKWSTTLNKMYTDTVKVPFARRCDNDDFYCYEIGNDHKIITIHAYASPGYERRKEYRNIFDWMRFVIDEYEMWVELSAN